MYFSKLSFHKASYGSIGIILAFVFLIFSCARVDPPYAVKVVDGDTIDIWTGAKVERVRLIGVDTPETKDPRRNVQYFGKKAYKFTTKLVRGETLRLERHGKDGYGRTLAYVYLPDGECINEIIIAKGYGFAYTKFSYARMKQYKRLEKTARKTKKGLWKDFIYEEYYVGNINSKVFHRPSCRLIKKLRNDNLIFFKSRQRVLQLGFRPCGVCRP